MRSNKYRNIIFWLLLGCFLVYAMVVIGGITRLTHSGLSMVEWSPTGSLPPMNEKEWAMEFAKYKQSPEFKLINYNFTLSDFKSIFWWEFIHRFLGRTIGIVFIIPLLFFILKKKFPPGFLNKMLLLLLIGGLQGFVGWFMVKSGLQKNPHVSHYRLAIHLITALTAFGFTFWFALDLIYIGKEKKVQKNLKKYFLLFTSLLVIQIVYGAFVAGLKAGYLYPTFPKMGNNWIPAEISILKPMWLNFFEGQAGVQFLHRTIAYLIVIVIGIIFFKYRRITLSLTQRKVLNVVVLLVCAQFLLGVLTVLYSVPLLISILHQTVAFFLFSACLVMIHRTDKG